MKVWFMGSALRKKNTVMFRRGWFALYLFDTQVKKLSRILASRELPLPPKSPAGRLLMLPNF